MSVASPTATAGVRIAPVKDDGDDLRFALRRGEDTFELRFSGSGEPLRAAPESGLALALFPAMTWGTALQVEGPISAQLVRAVPTIQEIFRLWDRSARIVPVNTAQAMAPKAPPADGVAAFFSGGVDSFFTALKHRERLTALIYVRGFDVPLTDAPRAAEIEEGVRAAAGALGLPLIQLATDVKGFSDGTIHWSLYHGAVMAAVAHLLSERFGRFLIPASHSYADLFPWGSHPLLDPLWSTERVSIEHDGAEATRPEKIRRLASDRTAMSWLRVCWESRGSEYNCGGCEKCIRTMAALRMVGALERCRTMPSNLDLARVRSLWFTDESTRSFWVEILEGAGASGDTALAGAAGHALRARPPSAALRRLRPQRIVRGAARRIGRLLRREVR